MQGFLSKPLTDVFNGVVSTYTDNLTSHLIKEIPPLKGQEAKLKEALRKFTVDAKAKISVGSNTIQTLFPGVDVVIVLNYTDKCHALFGNFGTIKDTLLANKCIENQRLAFGHGFVFQTKLLSAITQIVKDASLVEKQVLKADYVEKLSGQSSPTPSKKETPSTVSYTPSSRMLKSNPLPKVKEEEDDENEEDAEEEDSGETLKPIKTKAKAAPKVSKTVKGKKAVKETDEDEL